MSPQRRRLDHKKSNESYETLKKLTMNANLIVKLTQYIVHATIGSDDLADTLNNRCTG
jgi:hypothetical protein